MTEQKYKSGIVEGFKATDSEMKCRGFQFELGKWYECPEGDIIKCGSNGFHFCEQPSGPYSYYSEPGTRVFRVEAEQVLDEPRQPGADYKLVCRRIRFIEEITPTGNRNTGDGNTGNRNTGDGNTGYGNTGNRNTGDGNTGYGNTGDGNTGNRNTGDGNTGDGNTGYGNTGDGNTGNWNTGNWNTGDGNTGDGNTGDGNATDRSCGYFCTQPQTVMCFDVDSRMSHQEFTRNFAGLINKLLEDLQSDSPIADPERFAALPGYSREKVVTLHAKHVEGRRLASGL